MGLRSFPGQIKYIIGNEACERFSYYGMRSILVVFMTQYLLMTEPAAKGIYHTFISANYFLPLFGAYLSDRYLGKYKTILYLSLVYCLGHAVLAIWETREGLYAGLALISLGAGGIKPCVSAHVGDQFDRTNSHLIQKVFEIFYWSVNFGSFFSFLVIPLTLPAFGPGVAFGIPGVLMFLATVVFWMGRKEYVHVPPTGKEGGAQFFGVMTYCLTHQKDRRPNQNWFDVARAKFSQERVEGAQAVVGVFKVLIAVSAFWALFEQQGSTWLLQANQMDRGVFGYTLESSQIQGLNPIMVMILIPIFSLWLYPAVEKRGIKLTPLRKMGVGMVLTGLSFAIIGAYQIFIDNGATMSIGWHIPPFLILTASEVMVSITGLEFAYTQAPRAMKSTIMSLWLLTVAVGNWFTAAISFMNPFSGASEFFFYALSMFAVALIFVWGATKYRERSYIEGVLVPA